MTHAMNRAIDAMFCVSAAAIGVAIVEDVPDPKPTPGLQVVPMLYEQASFLRDGVEITPEKPLRLRYGLYIHSDMKPPDEIEEQWKRLAETP